MSFNPHARVGRDCVLHRKTKKQMGFNPHARVGRDG